MVNVRVVERDQQWLMPPSLAEWLPEGHLAWFVLDVVAELDLSGFYRRLRTDGRGGASYDPAMMLAVLVYAYCVGERSSRRIERRLSEDVAFRVVAANQCPDHATLARFRRDHADAIGEVFCQVLGVCVTAGLVDTGVVPIDGTKVEASASEWSMRTRRQIVDEILSDAEATDVSEDEVLGDLRGGELPEGWADRRDRRVRLVEALRQLDADGPSDPETVQREREAKEAELGRKLGGRRPDPDAKYGTRARTRRITVTDPDARTLKNRGRYIVGYNAQAAVTADQIIVAAEVGTNARDSVVFAEVVAAVNANLEAAGAASPGAVVADAGYWSVDNATMDTTAEVLIAPMPASGGITDPADPRLARRQEVIGAVDRGELSIRQAADQLGASTTWTRRLLTEHRSGRPDPIEVRNQMLERLTTDTGAAAYAKRKTTVEPVFGNIKANLGYRRLSRRGLPAAASEWRLICTVHNLLKLHRHTATT